MQPDQGGVVEMDQLRFCRKTDNTNALTLKYADAVGSNVQLDFCSVFYDLHLVYMYIHVSVNVH